MTLDELKQARTMAKGISLTEDPPDVKALCGYGRPDFSYVHCTIEQVAYVMWWDCLRLDGQWDSHALDEFCRVAKQKFLLV